MLFISILSILLSNAVNKRREVSILYNRIAILVLIYCLLNDITSLTVITKGISLHGGLLLISNITQIFHIFIFILTILILTLTGFYPRKLLWNYTNISLHNVKYNNLDPLERNSEPYKIAEYPLIILFVILGAIFLMSTNDLVSIFLSIELQSYGLYIISTIYRNSELSTTGGLMYFLLGGLSSCFILLGTGLIYANSGSTNLDNLYMITNISDLSSIDLWYKPYYINLSLILLVAGFLFKISAAPFHFWSPDVYDAIPTRVTMFVAIVAKISIFILLLQLVYYTNNNFSKINWTFILLISSLFSLIIGTVVGLTQFRIKRLYAYSTISHVGFILLALFIANIESTQAFIFYLIQYSISNLNAFLILIVIGIDLYFYNYPEKEYLMDKNNSPIQLVSQLIGYFQMNPWLAISLTITIFSFMGVPPLIGFFGKQMVLSAALDQGYIIMSLIAILTSVIGAIYYLNIIKEMFFTDKLWYKYYSFEQRFFGEILLSQDSKNESIPAVAYSYDKEHMSSYKLSSHLTFIISIITLIILLFIFINKEWLSMGTILVQIMFNN